MKDITESLKKTALVIKNTQQHIEDSKNLLHWLGVDEGLGDEGLGDDLINQLVDPILVIDAQGKFVFANKAASSLYGYTKQELLKMYIWNLNCAMQHEQIMHIIYKIFEGETLTFETSHKSKNGDVFSIEIHTSKVHLECCEYVLAVCRNITERKKLENERNCANALLETFIKHSPIYAYIKSVSPTESRVIQASENFQDMIGISRDQMIGKTMGELYPPEFAEKITADDWKVMCDGNIIEIEEEFNGRSYTTVKYPIKINGKSLLAGYTIDITERKKAEELQAKIIRDNYMAYIANLEGGVQNK